MRQQLNTLRDYLATKVWPLPAAMVLVAMLAAWISIQADSTPRTLTLLGLTLDIPVNSARAALAAMTTAVISLAGVAFSMALVALTMAAGHLGPKLLREYLRRNEQKAALGFFLAAFTFNLTVLLATDEQTLLVSTSVSLILTLFSLAAFVSFVEATSRSVQADQVIAELGQTLIENLEESLSEKDSDADQDRAPEEWEAHEHTSAASTLTAEQSAYLQAIDYLSLLELAKDHDFYIATDRAAGDFVLNGSTLARIYSNTPLKREVLKVLRSKFILGPQRTPVQDLEYPIVQIHQVAARALSSGINDPPTAIACIDWMAAAVARSISAHLPRRTFTDDDDNPRVVGRRFDFFALTECIFLPLRRYASDNLQVSLHVLKTAAELITLCRDEKQCEAIQKQAMALIEHWENRNTTTADQQAILHYHDLIKQKPNINNYH